MKPLFKRLRIMAVLPATALIALSAAAPSTAADSTCKTVIITIGVGCSQPSTSPSAPAPSPSEPKATSPSAQPSEPAPAPSAPPPAITPQPQTTIIIKEAPTVPAPLPTTPSPLLSSPALPAEIMTPAPILRAPDPTQTPTPAPPINGEQASAHNALPDFMKQAGEAAPYVFFIGLAGLISMLMVARSRKLFPFEDRTQRSGKTPSN